MNATIHIEPKLHAEIDQARDELRIAREQFAGAAGLHIDAAAMKVSACEMRLNCLYADARREPEEPACRVCGCTENNACPGGCWWVEADLCSSCVGADLTDKPSSAPLPEGSE